jgi:hypothetical protein
VQASRDVGNRKPFLYMAGAALFASLIGVWFYNSSAASGYESHTRDVQKKIDQLAAADRSIQADEGREREARDRANILENAITEQKYWVSLLNELNNLMKDDQIWIVEISPYSNGIPLSKPLWGNSPDYPFGDGRSRTPTGPNAAAKLPVTDLYVVAINRNTSGDSSGANALEFFRSIVKNPKISHYFEFKSTNEDQLLRDYLQHSVGDLANRDGYAFKMRLPIKRVIFAPPVK